MLLFDSTYTIDSLPRRQCAAVTTYLCEIIEPVQSSTIELSSKIIQNISISTITLALHLNGNNKTKKREILQSN